MSLRKQHHHQIVKCSFCWTSSQYDVPTKSNDARNHYIRIIKHALSSRRTRRKISSNDKTRLSAQFACHADERRKTSRKKTQKKLTLNTFASVNLFCSIPSGIVSRRLRKWPHHKIVHVNMRAGCFFLASAFTPSGTFASEIRQIGNVMSYLLAICRHIGDFYKKRTVPPTIHPPHRPTITILWYGTISNANA